MKFAVLPVLLIAVVMQLVESPVAAAPLHFDIGKRWLTVPFAEPAASPVIAMFGNINHDHKADAVLYNFARGEAYVAFSTGTGFSAPVRYSVGLPKFPDASFEVGLVDVNGDGLDDLVIMNHGADNVPGAATAMVALNTSKGFSYPAQPIWNASWCASYQRCLVGDINGDGKGDLIAFTPNFGTVWGTTSTGSAFGPDSVWNKFFCIRGEVCAVGDVNGDGKADIIAFKPNALGNQKGNVLWARSTGASFTDVKLGHGFFCIGNERCLVGDVNGDHRADIVLVKGWSSGAPTLEVLVSLSNGTAFVNAMPFTWATPPYFTAAKTFGNFALADVTGDGRADLIEWGQQNALTASGSTRATGFAIDVFAVTDRAPPGAPPPGPPPSAQGFSSIAIYNCQTDQHRVYYWNFDNTAGSTSSSGLTDAMYSEAGFCPDPNDQPQTFALSPGHIQTFVAVDPDAIGCEGRNDPSVVACAYATLAVRGGAGGGVCRWIVGGQAPSCFASLATRSLSTRAAGGTLSAVADRCRQGFVWREARPDDHVCVTPSTRSDTRDENTRAVERRAPHGGPFGPETCLVGFVWRDAYASDRVCVTPDRRRRASDDNAAAPDHLVRSGLNG